MILRLRSTIYLNTSIFLSIVTFWSFVSMTPFLDPTGTYQLDSKTKKRNGEIYGYTGQIQVMKLNQEEIIMTFIVNKGAPSYNSGSFVDTIPYKNNQSIYTCPEYDSTCKITFNFNEKGVNVWLETKKYNQGCGFGHAVDANGYYKKISTKTPILKDPLTGEKIEN